MSVSPMSTMSNELDVIVDKELYDNSPDCIKILDLDGSIKRLSPGGQVALELDHLNQLDGAHWPSLWPGSEQQRVEHAIAAGRDGKRTQFLAFCPTAKNSPRWWDVVVTPMPGKPASTRGLLVVSRDVTELVEAKEALAKINLQKDTFLAILSHELRNPLAAIGMAAKVLQASYGEVSQLSRMGELIGRQVDHMSRLAEDLLDVSRITRGQVNLQWQECDLRDVLRDAMEQLTPVLASKGQLLRCTVHETPVAVGGDRMRLAQVLGNLIANASRYSPENTPIDVAIVVQDQCVKLTVSDKGQGMSSKQLAVLFEMFSQGQATTDRRQSGVGLGLAIVKGLVELHGGTVQGDSAGVGMGSTFTLVLPLAGRSPVRHEAEPEVR